MTDQSTTAATAELDADLRFELDVKGLLAAIWKVQKALARRNAGLSALSKHLRDTFEQAARVERQLR